MTYSMTIPEYLYLGDRLCQVMSADGGTSGFPCHRGVNTQVQCMFMFVTKEAIIYYIFLIFTQLLTWWHICNPPPQVKVNTCISKFFEKFRYTLLLFNFQNNWGNIYRAYMCWLVHVYTCIYIKYSHISC